MNAWQIEVRKSILDDGSPCLTWGELVCLDGVSPGPPGTTFGPVRATDRAGGVWLVPSAVFIRVEADGVSLYAETNGDFAPA